MKTNRVKSLFNLVILFSVFLGACGPVTAIPPVPTSSPKPILAATLPPTLLPPTPTLAPSPTPILDTDCSDEGVVKPTLETFYENGKLARIGRGELYGVDWSSDGTKIAIASETGVYIFDAIRLEKINYINTGHDVEVVRFSPDGKWVAVDDDPQVEVWDVHSGALVAKIGNGFHHYSDRAVSPSTSQLGNVSFSPDGKSIALHRREYFGTPPDNAVEIWNIETQEMVREWKTQDKSAYPDPVFSPDGKLIASPWEDGVMVWDVETGEVVKQIEDASSFAFFSNDGQKIVTDGVGVSLLIVDLQSGVTIRKYLGDSFWPFVARFTLDDKTVVTHHNSHKESHVDTWDALTGDHLLSISFPERVLGIAFNPARNELVTIDKKQNVRIWNL
ncbi:MAG: hypothetical protein AB1750_01130, partial [Chloroflexota bacterium]